MRDETHRANSVAAPVTATRSPDTSRRRFLLAFGAGAAGAASASALAVVPPAVTGTAAAAPESQGYQETEHVRDYYASARM